MLKTMDFKNGTEIEKELNRILLSYRPTPKKHNDANKMIDELLEYGLKTKKLRQGDVDYYNKRKNEHKNGDIRTHMEFYVNLKGGQKREHKVFLYFIEWLKEQEKIKGKNREIRWELYGSDMAGEIIICSSFGKEEIDYTEPDYKVFIGEKDFLVEAKSFFTDPHFKIFNLEKYIKRDALMIFKYSNRYYLYGKTVMKNILKIKKTGTYGTEVVTTDQNYINELLKLRIIKEVKC